ncbi:hypothetical protein N7492_007942 [Penicillium capsulatum]|uniref:NAD-dependent epimerase/dehydratase domain-containing protein n=1 Tax=Penicillium capsulatum TaxID=69766 RepID=A0A9W9HRJ5_9EURO|nr:hypothetical protein N7492_007942 [Penicillium capsulatum]KAJ6105349.1 hypothetical protein N7512_008866 [Penicillium capsulatum]
MTEQTILVTGASGFVATHVLDVFLRAGYTLRGTVRSQEVAVKVHRAFQESERLEFAIVPDMTAPNAFDQAFQGATITGVIHTASPFQFEAEDNHRDLLQPAIQGTSNLLGAIAKHAPQLRRLVVTSSFAAMIDLSKGPRPGYEYSEADWNPMRYEDVQADTPSVAAYCVSKTVAERMVWDYVEKEKPGFDVASICPPMIYGPNTNATADLSQLNTSSSIIYQLMLPNSKLSDPVPPTGIWSWVDVRDVADAHFLAYENPRASGQRFFVCKGNYSNQQIADILRQIPEVRERVPLGNPGSGLGGVQLYSVNTLRSQEVLGLKYHSLEETILDTARVFLELEQRA